MIKTVESIEDVKKIRSSILKNIDKSNSKLKELINSSDSFQILSTIKFGKVGYDPILGVPLNFIEMLNQSFSDLVVLYGVEHLIDKYPHHIYTIRLGAQSGHDIESEDGTIIGECFAVTQMMSNNKLKKDMEKLLLLESNMQKYVFFYSENDTDEKISNFTKKYPEINCVRIRNLYQNP